MSCGGQTPPGRMGFSLREWDPTLQIVKGRTRGNFLYGTVAGTRAKSLWVKNHDKLGRYPLTKTLNFNSSTTETLFGGTDYNISQGQENLGILAPYARELV